MKLSELIQSRFNKRREYFPEMIEDLAQSIKELGLISRLTLRKTPSGQMEVLAGWRRRLALASIHGESYELPDRDCVILNVTDLEAIKISIVENVQRVNLSALDMAEAAKALLEENPSMKPKEIAKILWTTEARVKRLLHLDDHLDNLPTAAVDSLGMPDENDPAFTDGHVEVMAQHGAFDLDAEKVRDLCDLIIDQEIPASRVGNIVDKMIERENSPDHSDSGEGHEPSEGDNGSDPAMTDNFKGVLAYNESGDLLIKGKKEDKPVDLSYYHPFIREPDKFRVHVNAKVRIQTLD